MNCTAYWTNPELWSWSKVLYIRTLVLIEALNAGIFVYIEVSQYTVILISTGVLLKLFGFEQNCFRWKMSLEFSVHWSHTHLPDATKMLPAHAYWQLKRTGWTWSDTQICFLKIRSCGLVFAVLQCMLEPGYAEVI